MTAKWFGVHVRKFALGMGPIIGIPMRSGGRWVYRPLLQWGKGETEYSLRWFPLGGFVDLVGEHPEAETGSDPRGLCNKPAWQRCIVFSAGVVMNAVLAMVLFAVAPIVGIQAPVPIIGSVIETMPAAKAGIQPGDRIVAINGKPVQSFEDLIWTVALADAGTSFQIELERQGTGGRPELVAVTVASTRAPGSLFPMIGVAPEDEPVIAKMLPHAVLRQAGFTEGDRITAVNGQPVETWRGLAKSLADAPAGPVTLTRERGGVHEDVRVNPADLRTYEYGMSWPAEVTAVEPDSPAAAAGVMPGDRIAAVGDVLWPDTEKVSASIKAVGADGTVRLTLWRKGESVNVSCKTAMLPGADHPRIGVGLGAALGTPVQVGKVEAGGPADQAGVRPGDIILAAGDDGHRSADWAEMTETFIAKAGNPVPLQVQRGASMLATTVTPKAVPQERLTLADAVGSAMYKPLPRIYNPLVAAKRGFKETGIWLGRVYANIKQFLTGQVSTKAAAGPVGIVQFSMSVASHGLGTMMDFWGMLAVSIAVLNFLPIPPFDGGHVLFVLLEKIKGSPISLKVRTWVWTAGWAAVLLLFLVVTYRDILRAIS
jgi:regulator of sigma E protease